VSDVYDVVIIGSGPGGYVAAIRAAQLGLKTAIVEREHLGGICLNWGCIPTKALLRSAEVFHLSAQSKSFGFEVSKPENLDITPIVQRSRKVSGQLNGGVAFLLKKNKIDVIWGEASIARAPDQILSLPAEIEVRATEKAPVLPQAPAPKATLGPGTYRARNVILATGARPRAIPVSSRMGKTFGPISKR
jgi:dihydrolipoamide dehydrogenase